MSDGKARGLTPAEQRVANPERLVFLTDGVIAIIITILVLDIRVPELGSGQTLAESLTEVRPTFVSFVISFLLVGMFWTLHKQTFNQVRYIDHNSIWLNFLFLLPLALVPYASSALGEYSEEPTALHLYGVVLIAASLLRLGLDAYFQSHPGLLWEKSSAGGRSLGAILSWGMIAIYVIAMVVASWNTNASLVLFFSIPVLYFVAVAVFKSDTRTRADADSLD
ncbi:MAG: TMEM175 family protein [Acidimicrobiia bacterium]